MWVVDKIGFITASGEVKYDTFFFMSEYGLRNFNLAIHLRDTDTGMYKVLYNKKDPRQFMQELKDLAPYGFVNRNHDLDQIALDNYFVAVDDLSLQFLDYVESIERVNIAPKDSRREFAEKRLKSEFVSVDESTSIFVVGSEERCACTLFHAICFAPDGWIGDEFYLYSSRSLDWGLLGLDWMEVCYKLKFVDVAAARRLITKAIVSGINPVSKHNTVEIR